MQTLPIYDVVLLPPSNVHHVSVELSQKLSHLGTEFTLANDTNYPHLSLYMANLTPESLDIATAKLQQLAQDIPALALTANRYNQNEHGMFELFYAKTNAIISLQEAIIQSISPLRSGLRTLDPVGRDLADRLQQATGELRSNLEACGYDEVGSFFKPHITITRLKSPTSKVEPNLLPPLSAYDASFNTLALCKMGLHGTCTEIVAQFTLTI